MKKSFFTTALLDWHERDNDRSLPWKQIKDPYRIWLSEIMLQQTRAAQALPYYERFLERFPTVRDLAEAPESEVFRLWQGLGYYSRCKNLIEAAKTIVRDFGGRFPDSHADIRNLKGVGDYTAAAIASFAYGLPHAVVDGNVYRVLSRFFGIATPQDSTAGKKEFSTLAHELLDQTRSADFNQAIMDFGATICLPKNPACLLCPLNTQCVALREGTVHLLPVKEKKVKVKERFFNYLLLEHDGAYWLRKRGPRDVWENLYEPMLLETGAFTDAAGLRGFWNFLPESPRMEFAGHTRQRLTHQLIYFQFFKIRLEILPEELPEDGVWIAKGLLGNYPLPKTIAEFFEKL